MTSTQAIFSPSLSRSFLMESMSIQIQNANPSSVSGSMNKASSMKMISPPPRLKSASIVVSSFCFQRRQLRLPASRYINAPKAWRNMITRTHIIFSVLESRSFLMQSISIQIQKMNRNIPMAKPINAKSPLIIYQVYNSTLFLFRVILAHGISDCRHLLQQFFKLDSSETFYHRR
jgi:hypothetical protein